ncbi:MAG TPA: hypothetical protein VF128_10085 [Gemmatimonadaceae bacterium]
MMRRPALVLALALSGVTWTREAVSQVTPVDSTRVTWTTVTYLTGASVYLEAGTRAGLAAGSRVDVVRAGSIIAELVVEFVSSTRSSCRIVRSTAMPVIGDSARFVAAVERPAVVAGAAPPNATSSSRTRSTGTLRGRIGARYFSTRYVSGLATSVTQPALDARLDGQRLGGTPLGLTLDVRANRTRRANPSGATQGADTRVYQAAVHLDGAVGPGRITVGRQFATALSAVGLFDGVAADYSWRHTGAGLFAGSQPDAVTSGYSSAIREYGAWFGLHNAPGESGIWSLTTGAIGSYARDAVNREFLYVQGLFVNRALSLYASQEIDYNRGWKADAESTTTTPTATFATARVSLGPALSLHAGYDNRRSVRLYRDFLSPELEFDDSFRQGTWGGAQLSLGHVLAGFDTRASTGGSSGSSDSWTASAGLTRLTPLGLGARVRTTRYSGTLVEGELQSASLEIQPGGRFRLDVNGGMRKDVRALAGTPPTTLRWSGADFDIGIGRQLYLTFSAYRERGLDGSMAQYFGSLSYRF